jgi:hypothetical protein
MYFSPNHKKEQKLAHTYQDILFYVLDDVDGGDFL